MTNAARVISLGLAFAMASWSQAATQDSQQPDHEQSTTTRTNTKKSPGAGRDLANGSGDIAAGAGKAAGSLAKGGAKTAGDLVTLHPIDAGLDAGKGAGSAGKNVAVGTAKGTGKVVRGIGKAIKHLF